MSAETLAWFDRIRDAVVYDAARKANQAILDMRAEAEHIRRSIGQKVRWQITKGKK